MLLSSDSKTKLLSRKDEMNKDKKDIGRKT